MSSHEWDVHKAELKRRWLDENMKLPELIEHMARKGFSRKAKQYSAQFKKWNWTKYKPSLPPSIDQAFIVTRVEKRKREEGKDSEVIIYGEICPPEKLKKMKYGKGFVSTSDKLAARAAPAPTTPPGIIIRTPEPFDSTPGLDITTFMRLRWHPSLPWLRLCRLFQPELGQDSKILSPVSQRSWLQALNTQGPTTKVDIMDQLNNFVPWADLPRALDSNISARISATLGVLMPEEFEGQHESLSTGRLPLDLYMLANNLTLQAADLSRDALHALDVDTISIFRRIGWSNLKQLAGLLKDQQPALQAMVIKLFVSAVRLFDLKIVELLLKAGVDPDTFIDTPGHPFTPLAWAAWYTHRQSGSMIKLLLNHGASINKMSSGTPAITYAVQRNNLAAIRVLLQNKAAVPLELLAQTMGIIEVDLFKELLSSCPGACGFYRDYVEVGRTRHEGARRSSWVEGYTTLLGAAALADRADILDHILDTFPELVNPVRDESIRPHLSPLGVAIATGSNECIQPLIRAGADIHTVTDFDGHTLAELALVCNNLDAFQILIKNGSKIDEWKLSGKLFTSALIHAIKPEEDILTERSIVSRVDRAQLVAKLIQDGADLNGEYDLPPGTALAAAIEGGDCTILSLLVEAGAATVGQKLRFIGTKEAARFLDQRGLLPEILDAFGAQILAHAIWEQDVDFAQWLVAHKILASVDCSAQENAQLIDKIIETDDLALVEALLEHGLQVTDHHISLSLACIKDGNDTILQRLLRDFRGNAPSALAYAAFQDRADLVQLLLASRAGYDGAPIYTHLHWERPNPDDTEHHPDGRKSYIFPLTHKPQSILELAVEGGSMVCLQMFIKLRTWSPTLVCRALALAIRFSEREMADELYQLRPRLDGPVTLSRLASTPGWDGEQDLVDEEQAPGDFESFTPLQAAAQTQNVSLVQRMLDQSANAGVNVNINCPATGAHGRTALQHAVENGNLQLMDMLLKHGADVNGAPASYAGATALQLASIKGFIGIARRLIDLDARVNAPGAGEHGRTALEGAAEAGRTDVVEMLLQAGAARLDEVDDEQYTNAADLATGNGHAAILNLLSAHDPEWWEEYKHLDDDETDDGVEELEGDHNSPGSPAAAGADAEEWEQWVNLSPG
ncbi:ankyrin repeat-containing domain protein [Aspergillus carlsbadensis]|nr:ankyrin repeat-containing domain protein [Aspergillus carlsbadensis]